ncbi:sulfotransferase domain-containing protein [Nioella sp.]|uniref:sulfotransferase domain-containing protein n=1 Tax=Nioella sp. TaxID=1912091 RepID=UPI003B51EA6F
MLVACFGIHKSASTFAYRIATQVARHVFEGDILTGSDVLKINKAFMEENKNRVLSRDLVMIQKTHSGTNTDLSKYVADGDIRVIASIRDLRDVALSMIDAGAESRAAGKLNQMAAVHTIDDAVVKIKDDVAALNRWSKLSGTLFIPYNEIRVSPESIIGKVSVSVFNKQLSSEECDKINESIPRSTIRLNKGVKDRYKSEMSRDQSEKILSTFPEYYEKFRSLL